MISRDRPAKPGDDERLLGDDERLLGDDEDLPGNDNGLLSDDEGVPGDEGLPSRCAYPRLAFKSSDCNGLKIFRISADTYIDNQLKSLGYYN